MTEQIVLRVTIPAFIALLLWRYHLQIIARFQYRGVVVPMSKNPTYYFVGNKANRRIPAELENYIYKRDHEKCQLCGVGVFRGNANSFTEHLEGIKGDAPGNIDHRYIPASFNGPAIEENLWLICQPCNVRKSDMIDTNSLRWLARRGETICLKKTPHNP